MKYKDWEKEVDSEYLKKEYQGIYESVLHLRNQLDYLRSKEGKKFLTDLVGALKYEENVSDQIKSLGAREAELNYMRNKLG